jgi:hypothetical protein
MHPFTIGFGSGIISFMFTESNFSTGFTYGFIAGITNIAILPLGRYIRRNTSCKEIKALTIIGSSAISFAMAYYNMKYIYTHSNNNVFYIHPNVAMGLGIISSPLDLNLL